MILKYIYQKLEKEVKRTGHEEGKLSDFDSSKTEVLEELKNIIYHDLEDLLYRIQLTYDEIIDKLDIKYFASKTTSYTLPPGLYEIGNINKTLQLLLPDIVEVSITIDDIRIKSKLKFTKF